MPKIKIWIGCAISAVVSYAAIDGLDALKGIGMPGIVSILAPGLVFYLALYGAIARSVSRAWQAFMLVAITGGWYLAWQATTYIESPTYYAGAVGGAIGGAAMFVALLSHPKRRTFSQALQLTVAGAVIGTISLPAGFLFVDPKEHGLDYIFLTFLPWQIGMGYFVTNDLDDQTSSHFSARS